MKNLSIAFGTAAVLAFAALATPAQAQPHHHGYRPHVIVVQPPPPRYAPRHGYYAPPHRHGGYRHFRRDSDRDGVPDRYDRRPNNPYRR